MIKQKHERLGHGIFSQTDFHRGEVIFDDPCLFGNFTKQELFLNKQIGHNIFSRFGQFNRKNSEIQKLIFGFLDIVPKERADFVHQVISQATKKYLPVSPREPKNFLKVLVPKFFLVFTFFWNLDGVLSFVSCFLCLFSF